MIKPILIMRFPYMEDFNYDSIAENLFNHPVNKEYHVLVTKESGLEQLEIETHNVLNATDIDLEELKKELEEKFTKK